MATPSSIRDDRAVFGDEQAFERGLNVRNLRGTIWKRFFQLAVLIAMLALVALFFNVINSAFGYVVLDYDVRPATLTPDGSGDLETLTPEALAAILAEYEGGRLPVYIRDYLYSGDPTVFTQQPMRQLLPTAILPEGTDGLLVRDLSTEQQAQVLSSNLAAPALSDIVLEQVVGQQILRSYSLVESLFNRNQINVEKIEEYPDAILEFRSWISLDFIISPMSSNPAITGISSSLLGTIFVVVLTILIALPIGVGAAIYLEEYADPHNRFNRIIETNIRNLAGVPSIIYGLLGLAIFVRVLSGVTGGRTIVSAAFTMALLILPVIIINAQEALRAVPSSIREASYGVGATRWQTIWNQVLPAAVPGILTGMILALSRAIGETAPLILVGASTLILFTPTLESRFTVLPIQIYNYTSRPQQEFRDAASAAIIVLLVLLLLLNATAIYLRQRFRRSLSA